MAKDYKTKHEKWKIIEQSQDTIPDDATRTDTNISSQDTIVTPQDTITDTTHAVTYEQDSIQTTPADSIRDTTAIRKEPAPAQPDYTEPPEKPAETIKFDTINELYEIFNVTELPISKRLEKDPSTINFLYNIPVYAPKKNTEGKEVFKYSFTEQDIKDKVTQREIKIAETTANTNDWITWVLIGLFLLIGWSRLFFKKYFSLLFKSLFFLSYAEEIYHDKNPLTTRVSMALNINYFIILGIFSYQLYVFYGNEFIDIQNTMLISLLFSAFFIAWYIWNAIFSGLVGSLFEVSETYNKYLYNYNLHRKVIGIIIFPLAIIIQFIAPEFREPFFKAGIILFGILYFTHIIRGLQIFVKDNVSIFHLILYLCALEFLPLIVLFDVLAD